MVLECYHYKYTTAASNDSCSGSFEQCATLVKCNTDNSTSDSICFALAKPATNSTNNYDTIILSGGCYPSVNQEVCDKKCLGHQKANGNYYCCCTENGCNKQLTPRVVPTSLSNTTLADNLTHISDQTPLLDTQPKPNNNITLLVVITVVLIAAIIVTYFKRLRRKRGDDDSGRIDHRSNSRVDTGDIRANNAREMIDIRSNQDASVTVPFRNSFGDANNFHYGQQRSHSVINHNHNDNNNFTNNYAPRMNLNNAHNTQQHQHQPHHQHQTNISPIIDLKRIELLDEVGSGRFGVVRKATLASEKDTVDDKASQKQTISEIAVKIIPSKESESFQNELKIYSSTKARHPNILNFLGYTESPETSEYWLLVEYASNGSLHHYLKENTVTWPDFLLISSGIVRGLSHLHDADIAHRDFKSKNVLLRHNLSPCITDFGVASKLDYTGGSQTEQKKKYLQVGTPRYMAPEVLECSVSFSKISFTKIDVYALSLVLWELLSRCYPIPKPKINDGDNSPIGMPYLWSLDNNLTSEDEKPLYKMPFEDVVGPNPDINTMRQAVVNDRIRPPIKPEWQFYPLSKLCQAIVDGWEYDYDARISASCFVERIETLLQEHMNQQNNQPTAIIT